MSDISSHLQKIVRPSQSRSKDDKSAPVADSDCNKQLAPKPEPEAEANNVGFLELVPGCDPVVDIVAIHGLNGHRRRHGPQIKGCCGYVTSYWPTRPTHEF